MKFYKIPGIGLEIPFDKESYLKSWKRIVLPYVAIGSVVIFVGWQEILLQDVFGLAFTSFIIAYIWHIVDAFDSTE